MARPDGIHGPKRARYGDGTVVSLGDIIGDPTQVQPRGPHEADDRPRVSRINHGAGVVFLGRRVLDGSRVVPEDLGWFFADKLQAVPS